MGEHKNHNSALVEALERATAYEGDDTALWQAALDETPSESAPARSRRRLPPRLAIAACIAILGAGLVMTMNPISGRARMSSAPTESAAVSAQSAELSVNRMRVVKDHIDELIAADLFGNRITTDGSQPTDLPSGFARQVIRTARAELRVGDVDAAYRAVRALVRPEAGEYVQKAGLRGEGEDRRGSLAIRVRADRLEAVVEALSELGEVIDQKIEGRDVTERIVDLDARLRNERRIETELLTLLDERQNSPLEDVLRVRTELGRVRGAIERLSGETASLARMVALATVHVELRPADEAAPEEEELGAIDIVRESLGGALRSGADGLLASVALILEVAVGGLLWWMIVIIAGTMAFRRWKITRAWA